MACGIAGGYTAIRFGTSVATGVIQSSTSITGLLNGTNFGPSESTTIRDAAGRNIQTGTSVPGTIRTSLVTGTAVSTMFSLATGCTDVYFRFVGPDGTAPLIGPVRVVVDQSGSEVEDLHATIISFTGFDSDAKQIITY